MTTEEKIALLEEIMDVEEGTLKLEDELNGFDEWDSLSALAYIAEVRSRFNKTVTGDELKRFVTVSDAVEAMEP